jgi:hypothetical protein
MAWIRKLHKNIPKRYNGVTKHYSISNKLKKEKKITDEFEIMLASLTLEEIIGLKLELASRTVGGLLYGFPLWGALQNICQDAVLRYVISAARSNSEAARVLGVDKGRLKKLYKKFDLYNYFDGLNAK